MEHLRWGHVALQGQVLSLLETRVWNAKEGLPMLVLSRQRDGQIMIGDEIVITVVDIRGDKVRLGISAPGKIPVHRREIYEAIKAEALRQERSQTGGLGQDVSPVIPVPAQRTRRTRRHSGDERGTTS